MKVIKKWANPEQQWFIERGAAPTLLVGGINSGKTVGACLKSIALLHKYPGSRMAVVRRSHTQLLKTTVETWYQWCLPQMYDKGSRNESVLNLNNGSRVYFIHLDQPDSLDLLAGLELNFAYVSQVEEISEKAWDLLDVRIGRWTGASVPAEAIEDYESATKKEWRWKNSEGVYLPPSYLFAEGYVTDEGHWVYRRFAPESPERERWAKQGYESRIVFSETNIHANKTTIEAALSKDDDYVRRYVRPEWGNPEGKIFKIDPLSLLRPESWLLDKIMQSMKLHRSLDHGEYSPTCCLWDATDAYGNIFIYREYYVPDALVSDHRKAIYELGKEDGARYHSNLADPSIFNKIRGRTLDKKPQWSVADEYTDTKVMPKETAIYWQPAENDEEATRSRLKEYLRVDPTHRHPVTGQLGAPRLYFLIKTSSYPRGCNMVTKEIGAQMRLKAKVGDREVWLDERDEKVIDHAYDAVKYFVVSRPSLGPEAPPTVVPLGQIPLAEFEKLEAFTRRRKRLEDRKAGVSKYGYGEKHGY